jgi:Spy/CpxP family protein refolding chaperone
MKNKLITAVAVLTLGASLAVAAPHGGGKFGGNRGDKGEFGAKFAQELNLTDAQKAQIKAIHQESRQNNKAVFEAARQTMQDFRAAKKAGDTAKADAIKANLDTQRAQMKQIREAEMQKVASILTAEQRAKLEQMKAERKGKHGSKRQID